MRIKSLELQTADLEGQRDFYEGVLGLPVRLAGGKLGVTAGWSQLVFSPAAGTESPLYHFAFNIPENQFDAAMAWTAARTAILADASGERVFPSESWNAHAMYFKDAAGNILEFIARHDLRNAVNEEFDSGQILCVSEIGLGTEDVTGLVRQLGERLGISPFKGEGSDTFTAVGDDEGLFIVVQRGRIWRPDSGVPADVWPVDAAVEVGGKQHRVTGVPYKIL